MTTSGLLLITCCIILAIWDMIAVNKSLQDSESWFIRRVAQKYPSFVFCLGVLIGHFLAAMTPGV